VRRSSGYVGQVGGAVIAVLCAAAVGLALVPSAHAFVYWSNIGTKPGEQTIGRANLDGSNAQRGFIAKGFAGAPTGVAVSAEHVYWSDSAGGLIGRANLDGTGVIQRFIVTGAEHTFDLAIGGGKIYWLAGNTVNSHGVASIGRANLDGSGIEPAFITSPEGGPGSIAVDATHLYWIESQGLALPQYDRIVRANLDGSDRRPLVTNTGAYGRFGYLAVGFDHIYWGWDANFARANLDGSAIEPQFIAAARGIVRADDAHLYWGAKNRIGRANLDGSARDDRFIAAHFTDGIAVDALHGPAAKTPTKPEVDKRGRVRLPQPWITCPAVAPGCTATVRAKAAVKRGAPKRPIGGSSYAVAAGESALVHFTLTPAARKALTQHKRLKATVTITTVHGGRATKRTEQVTLKA
jgi:sugar lactone lactonase YvrE